MTVIESPFSILDVNPSLQQILKNTIIRQLFNYKKVSPSRCHLWPHLQVPVIVILKGMVISFILSLVLVIVIQNMFK